MHPQVELAHKAKEMADAAAEPAVQGDTIELCDADESCRVLGGSKPINRATLYRGVKEGRYPRPIHLGPATSRWIKAELLDCVRARIAERDRGAA
jgi:predicted DNA-binding transcriptional regulator AlpA